MDSVFVLIEILSLVNWLMLLSVIEPTNDVIYYSYGSFKTYLGRRASI